MKTLAWPFWLWALVGVGFGLGISSLGIFIVPASAVVTMVLLTRPGLRGSAYGALVGIGTVLLFVAFDNREGPGTVCHSYDHGRGMRCDELYDPRKWLVAGLVLVAAGLIAQARLGEPRESARRASRG